jgi:predicted RNase H-like HicB family nuclease
MRIEIEKELDGRWIAEVMDLPGVMGYGQTREAAISKVEAMALRVIADRLEHRKIGLRMLIRIGKRTGLKPEDL